MGQLQLLNTGTDPTPLSAAAALDSCKWYNSVFLNLVVWDAGICALPDFFDWNMRAHPESWTHNTDQYPIFQPAVSLSDVRVSGCIEMQEKFSLDSSRMVAYYFPLFLTLLSPLSEDKSEFGGIFKPNFWAQVSSEED